ncbi:MAG: hypothetical protein ABSF84_02795 [Acidimicrobiales bacterium]|jgi:hypothetical protein
MTVAAESVDANTAAYQAWLATPAGQAAINAQQVAAGAHAAAPVAPAAPAAPMAVAPAPAAAAPTIDYDALAQALVKAGAVPTSAAAPAPAPESPPSPVNLFTPGQIVTHTWNDVYSGKVETRKGIVIEIQPDAGSGATSVIGWFAGVSGPIGDQNLTAG